MVSVIILNEGLWSIACAFFVFVLCIHLFSVSLPFGLLFLSVVYVKKKKKAAVWSCSNIIGYFCSQVRVPIFVLLQLPHYHMCSFPLTRDSE